jgi:flagellin
MASTNAMNKSNNLLSTAMERLGTGKRINSADDAAGLQIATRLQGQTNGMTVAQRNISDATAMLQTAEGAFDEVSNIMYRMKDLATQAANDTNSDDDRTAIGSEMTELKNELNNIMDNTKYAGDNLFGTSGKLAGAMNFQIGSSTDEKLTVDVSGKLSNIDVSGGLSIDVSTFAQSQATISGLKMLSQTWVPCVPLWARTSTVWVTPRRTWRT